MRNLVKNVNEWIKYILVSPTFLFPILSFGQNLDFGEQDPAKVVSPESMFPYADKTLLLFSIYLVLGASLITYVFLKKRKEWVPPALLEDFPLSGKVAITLAILSYGLVHIFALWEVYLVATIDFKSASEYFFYMKLPKLVATSHAHFFGHGTMYLITGSIFIFSKLRESWKIVFITLALSAGLLDVPSWWAIKYGGGKYEIFSALAGTMSVIGWGFMAIRILYEVWWSEVFRRKA